MPQDINNLIFKYLPGVTPEELAVLANRLSGFSEEQVARFCSIYNSKRKDPQIILLTCLLGFVGVSGIHRFLMEEIGMGILYFFTAGLCLIGTIVDIVNYKNLAIEYNGKKIAETLVMLNMFKP
jgi:TM2 domain-containing membrane protein YozV